MGKHRTCLACPSSLHSFCSKSQHCFARFPICSHGCVYCASLFTRECSIQGYHGRRLLLEIFFRKHFRIHQSKAGAKRMAPKQELQFIEVADGSYRDSAIQARSCAQCVDCWSSLPFHCHGGERAISDLSILYNHLLQVDLIRALLLFLLLLTPFSVLLLPRHLNRQLLIAVGMAGPQPPAPDRRGHCRSSTASSRSQWALPTRTSTSSARSQWASDGSRRYRTSTAHPQTTNAITNTNTQHTIHSTQPRTHTHTHHKHRQKHSHKHKPQTKSHKRNHKHGITHTQLQTHKHTHATTTHNHKHRNHKRNHKRTTTRAQLQQYNRPWQHHDTNSLH